MKPAQLYECIDKVESGDRTSVMLLPLGTWHTAKYGDLPFDSDFAEKLIANYESALEETEPFIDSGRHDEQTPASAWVKRLFRAPYKKPESDEEGEAVWAEVEWTEEGAKLINSKAFKYLSPAISKHVVTKTGEELKPVLRSITPTNIPVLRAMPSVLDAPEWLAASEEDDLGEVLLDEVAIDLAEWSTAAINDLPDSSFAYISPGGSKEDGKTVPRSLRHFPIRDGSGKLDAPHVRNALARLPQSALPSAVKAKIRGVLERAARELGIGEYTEEQENNEMQEVAKALLLNEDADEATVLAEIKRLHDRVLELEEERQQAEKASLDQKRDTLLKELLEGGHIAPAEKEVLVGLAEANFGLFEQVAESRKGHKVIPLGEQGYHKPPSEPDYSDPAAEVARRAKVLQTEESMTFSDAMEKVLGADEELRREYHAFTIASRTQAQ